MDRVYLDLCCLKRPFDDQRQERIRREADAVAGIFERAEAGEVILVRSPAHLVENEANSREDRRLATALWLDGFAVDVALTEEVEARSRDLSGLGFMALDALHLALAEAASARWLVTCDDRLVTLARRHAGALRLDVLNPLAFPGRTA